MTSSPSDNSIRSSPRLDCYICGTPGQPLYVGLQDRLFGAPGRWSLDQCPVPDCELIWLNPQPTDTDISKAYTHYFTHQSHTDNTPPAQRKGLRSLLSRSAFLQQVYAYLQKGYLATAFGYMAGTSPLQRLISYGLKLYSWETRRLAKQLRYLHYVPNGKLLDVGCGNGLYLANMKKWGWHVEGLEIDPKAVEQARNLGFTVHEGCLENCHLKNASFDAITLNHVIEHVHDPSQLLRECCRILKPGGVLVAITPNVRSATHQRFREYWRGLEPPRHIYIFSPPALQKITERTGLRTTVHTTAFAAKWMYLESLPPTQSRPHTGPLGRLMLALKIRLFDLYESATVLLGKDWGEEIVLMGHKW